MAEETCCCFDMKTGGLIVGYIGLVANVIFIYFSFTPIWLLILTIISTLTVVCWLYGIHSDKPKVMLPELVLSVTLTIVQVCLSVIILITAFFGINLFNNIASAMNQSARTDVYGGHAEMGESMNAAKGVFGAIIFVLWFLYSILAAIHLYFTSIKYKVYMLMKKQTIPVQVTNELASVSINPNPTAPMENVPFAYPSLPNKNVV